MRCAFCFIVAALTALLVLPAGAGAALMAPDSSFGSGPGGGAPFAQIGGIATDEAGRVYVAETGAGRVQVFDSGEAGNAYLGSIGEGVLHQPVDVEVDIRNRVFVTDQVGDKVLEFDNWNLGSPYMRQWGGSGTALGKMAGPRFVATDQTGLAYNTEAGNVRVQWFGPQDKAMVPLGAFGTADPGPFANPEGITIDGTARQVYVSNYSPTDGSIHVFDGRGLYLGQIGAPGADPGQLNSPRGLTRDSVGRLVVADSGNNRVDVFNSFLNGGGFIDSYSDGLVAPGDVAFAPGAWLYVADVGSGTVKRLHYDDADRDGVLDYLDNCQGLANPDQENVDRDSLGDACDSDIDNDGVANPQDRCPTLRGPAASGGCPPPRVAARQAARRVRCSTRRGSRHARAVCAARKRAAARRAARQAARARVALGRR